MTDIITRLRERAARKWRDEGNRSASLFSEAADEIERLRAELGRCGGDNCMGKRLDGIRTWVTYEALDAAVAAERERCAQLCADRSAEYWRDYKDKSSAWRGDTRTEAMSDEAEACAKAIRAIATLPADTATASRSSSSRS